MFTGIINNLGKVREINGARLTVRTDRDFANRLYEGASVAIDGICLTVVDKNEDLFSIEVMPETVDRTNFKYLQPGNILNLEMPAAPESYLAGHIVQGHIDTAVPLQNISDQGNSRILKFSVPESLSKYIVEKGSIAVNGVSLTIIESGKDYFTVGIIPHTWEQTMFHSLKVGDFANIEVDVLAKYIEKLIKKQS
jgi:riboflavin synthase